MMLKAINKPIADIKVNDIRAYLAFEQLNKNVSNSYLDTKLRYLKSFFKTLRIEGYIPNDPAEKITKIKAEKVIRKPFTPIETENQRCCRKRFEVEGNHRISIIDRMSSYRSGKCKSQ